MRQYTFHLLCQVHLPTHTDITSCAFNYKNLHLAKMLTSLGHKVYAYCSEGSNIDEYCNSDNLIKVQTHLLKDIRSAWGEGNNLPENLGVGYDWHVGQFKHDINESHKKPVTMQYYSHAITTINKVKQPDDFLLMTQGFYQKPIADAVNLYLTVESGVGYRGSLAKFRSFESSYIQNFTYGSEHPRESINGNYYDTVIGNYFEDSDFVFSKNTKDYYLYIGRMIQRKGVLTAVKATEVIGAKLILAGQTSNEINVNNLPSHCEFIGFADKKKRNEILGGAIATFVPTTYLEPFAGTHIESMLCGTPVITTSFGVFGGDTFIDGVHGFKCSTLDDFVFAAKNAHKLDRKVVRANGERFLMDNIKWQYQKWFDDLMNVYESTQNANVKGWHRIREEEPKWREHIYKDRTTSIKTV